MREPLYASITIQDTIPLPGPRTLVGKLAIRTVIPDGAKQPSIELAISPSPTFQTDGKALTVMRVSRADLHQILDEID